MKKTKICLNAMVANESRTILRMLESCYKYVDYWVIQDNGSTDNTKELIRDFFTEKQIPGFLYEIDWKYPGWNRNHTLQECLKANHGCDWILRMDADETLQVDDDFDWSILDDTSVQSWNITARAGETKYFRTWMWNSKLPWFFQDDIRHETIHLPEIGEGFQRVTLPFSFRHMITNDGQTWFAPRKFLKDALELEIDKVVSNKVIEDSYHLFYIAKSYTDCYGDHTQYAFGKKHSDEFARRGIFYFERFLNQCHGWDNERKLKYQDEMSYFSLILMGLAYEYLGEDEKAIEHYNLSNQFSPMRNEHYVYLSTIYYRLGKNDEVLQILDEMEKPERKNPYPNLCFLIEDRAYYDTGSYIKDMRNQIIRGNDNPSINLNSFEFDFN